MRKKEYPPRLYPTGSYQDFDELKNHLEKAPDTKITICMDKALLEGGTIGYFLEHMAKQNQRLESNCFKTINYIKSHIKYRETHDHWVFDYTGDLSDENTHVRLVGLGY